MISKVLALTQCSNNHTVITLVNEDVKTTPRYKGFAIYKAYVDKFDNIELIGELVEHSKPFNGWVKIKTDINAISDNK